jgi:hypothetical protein
LQHSSAVEIYPFAAVKSLATALNVTGGQGFILATRQEKCKNIDLLLKTRAKLLYCRAVQGNKRATGERKAGGEEAGVTPQEGVKRLPPYLGKRGHFGEKAALPMAGERLPGS